MNGTNHRLRNELGSMSELIGSAFSNTEFCDAKIRLQMSAIRCQQARETNTEVYYGIGSQLEETIEGIAAEQPFDAVVTRNHYGSLVLNARHTLFIDVDFDQKMATTHSDRAWSETFEVLCTVLANEQQEGFRIYRTAAGF